MTRPLSQWIHSTCRRRSSSFFFTSPSIGASSATRSSFTNDAGQVHFRRGFRNPVHPHHTTKGKEHQRGWRSPWAFYSGCAVALGVVGVVGYESNKPFRHTVLAVVRCSKVAGELSLAGSGGC